MLKSMKLKYIFKMENKQKKCRAMSKAPKIICKNALTRPPPLSHLQYFFVAIIFLQIHYFVQDKQQATK